MDCTQRISENPIFVFNNLRISCPESHVSQSRKQEQAKRVPLRRAGSAIGQRVSSCRDGAMNSGTAHCQQLLNCPHTCKSRQKFPRNDIGNLQLWASDPKSYTSNDDTGLHKIYSENVTLGATLMPNSAHLLLTNQVYPTENAQKCPSKCDINGGLKSTDSTNVMRQDTKKKSSNNTNYINTTLVQKVLDSQKNLRRTRSPMIRLGEVSRTGQNSCKREKPMHHLSDTSLNNKAVDSMVKDLDTVSTESQKESGYHSGGSAGDCSSDKVDLNRFAPQVPVLIRLSSAPPGTSIEQCDYYFVQADDAMDKYKEQERLGNLNLALDFLNQAIEFFQMASNVAGSSSENVLRMRMKHNKAVLCRRKLVRHIGLSTKKASRRLPCPPKPKTQISTVHPYLQTCKQFFHSDVKNVSSAPSRVEQVSYLKNKIPEEHKIVSFSGLGNCCQKAFPEKTNDDIVHDFDLHNTLLKKNRNGLLKHEREFSSPDQWSENLLPSNCTIASCHNENDIASRESVQKKNQVSFRPTTGHSSRRAGECHLKNRSQLSKTPTDEIRDSTASQQNGVLHFRQGLPSNAKKSCDAMLRDQRRFIWSWSEVN